MMPVPFFSGRLRDELFGPCAEPRDRGVADERELIATGFRERTEYRAEPDARGLRGFRRAVVCGQRTEAAVEDRRVVVSGQRRRNHPEVRERGISAADIGIVLEGAQEAGFLRFGGERGAGIGDRDERSAGVCRADPLRDAIVEVPEKRLGLDGRAALARDDEERVRDVERCFERANLARIGRIEHVELRVARHVSERLAQHVRSERTSTHAENDDVREVLGAIARQGREFARSLEHGARKIEPPKRVLDDLRVG